MDGQWLAMSITPKTARRLAWSVGLASLAMMAIGLVITYIDRHAALPSDTSVSQWNLSTVLNAFANMGGAAIGIVLASRRPENRIGWLFTVAGFTLGLGALGSAYGGHALVASPGSLPGGELAAWVGNWIWPIPICMLTFLFLLFPTGRTRSRRWLPVGWFLGVSYAFVTTGMLVVATLIWNEPFVGNAQSSRADSFAWIFLLIVPLFLTTLLASLAAVVVRYKGSTGDERLQMKWFAAGSGLVVATFTISFWSGSAVANVAQSIAFLFLWAAIGVAVLKYRLYEIDVVINRAVVYGSLAVFITLVYVGLVIGVGTVVGNTQSPLLSAAAAAVVAIAFQPVRQWARRLANRVVYGRRATPYEVLSDFAERIAGAYASEDVLPRMAQLVAAGTGAQRAVVWLRVGNELRPEASSDGIPEVRALPLNGGEPPVPEGETAVPVSHNGELLGTISIRMPRGEPLAASGERLVADVASQAGLVLSNVRLIEELRASRQRLVAAQDAERRKLERNLHDGAQQQLVALAVKQRLAASMATKDPEQTARMLETLQADTTEALENLRDLARGIYPPLLADQGLAAALQAQTRKIVVPTVVEADGTPRYSQDVEAAVYFCCLEALQNVTKYAGALQARVRLTASDGWLSFQVTDDGAGFDPSSHPYGSGLQGMADRLDALGGALEVRSSPGSGTTVVGRVPVAGATPAE
jgi:signal transduction histidine kinase